MMWIEAAKAQWAMESGKEPEDQPTEADLLPYLARIEPSWGGRVTRMWEGYGEDAIPTCYLTHGQTPEGKERERVPYILGNVVTRVQCPVSKTPHVWNEKFYQLSYPLE